MLCHLKNLERVTNFMIWGIFELDIIMSIDITDTIFHRFYTYRYFVAYQVVDKDHM